MTTEDLHGPSKEFVDHLEWEVVSAYRRVSRLDEQRAARRLRQRPWLRAAAIVLVSIAIGTTAGLASAQMRDTTRRASLLDAARADAALAATRLEIARQQLLDAQKKVDVGAVGAQSLLTAASELRRMEAQAARVKYNIDEINASALPPRDDLGAPLVGGRDFVKDRIQLDLMTAQQQLSDLESAQAEVERRVRVGASPEISRTEAQTDVARARAKMAVLADRLSLRREFLEKGTPIDQLSNRLEQSELRQLLYSAQQSLNLARERVALVQRQQAAGMVDTIEILRSQLEVKSLEIDARRLLSRLNAVRSSAPDSLH
jgi:outer membrane protein TolC